MQTESLSRSSIERDIYPDEKALIGMTPTCYAILNVCAAEDGAKLGINPFRRLGFRRNPIEPNSPLLIRVANLTPGVCALFCSDDSMGYRR